MHTVRALFTTLITRRVGICRWLWAFVSQRRPSIKTPAVRSYCTSLVFMNLTVNPALAGAFAVRISWSKTLSPDSMMTDPQHSFIRGAICDYLLASSPLS